MSDWFKSIIEKIKSLNAKLDNYKKDTVIQSLPSVALVNRAKKAMNKGQYKEALEILKRAESLPQQDALVYKYQGIIYDKLFRFDDAVKAYKISANLNPNDKIIWNNLAFALMNLKIYDEAEECFENADKITPANSEVLMGWGMSLMKQNKISDAREKFVLSSKFNRYNSNALFLAAVMEVKLKMYDEAESKLQFLTNVAPSEANAYEYANLKFIKNDYEAAIFYANKSISLNKNMLPAYILLGRIYRIRAEEDMSLQNYKQAETLTLIAPWLYVEWALSLIKFEKYDEALEKIAKAEELDTETSETKFLKSFCLAATDREGADKEVFEKAVNDGLFKALAFRGLGMLACKRGDFTESVHYFKSALKEDSTDVINYYCIAKAYTFAAENSSAKQYFETSIKENPKHLRSYLDYAEFLIAKEDYADANRKLRKAIRLDEKNLRVLNMLFYVNYILVKHNVCEYNIKETLEFEKQIKNIDENAFKYPDKSAELAGMLTKLQEKEQN